MSAYQSFGPLFDICQNRHKGNEESNSAFESIKSGLTLKQKAVLQFIRERGELGATTDEVAAHFNSTPNEVSGRMSELKRKGKIKTDGRRRLTRNGCCMAAVCVINHPY